ncbi:Hypothetical protein NGAL_HAMBI2427_42050 [Neorhizobium galegae bv. orientalis]|uniref:Uncharacterized protein n=1 Tax=Neorhizobium galegae bv. orientalis str. HAMBI 540 TaxID=1028800 RepID=A0A068T1J5_NEOGA|nr:Hypothetical protein RG540_PA12630 [Neorhizobium galegae bv. orientalis str. HAMBI 540]CDZ51541.1 Hypothetical protein NGAL_HAMBI2427_42050 [Neorhizobium galegae bv. orientalis]
MLCLYVTRGSPPLWNSPVPSTARSNAGAASILLPPSASRFAAPGDLRADQAFRANTYGYDGERLRIRRAIKGRKCNLVRRLGKVSLDSNLHSASSQLAASVFSSSCSGMGHASAAICSSDQRPAMLRVTARASSVVAQPCLPQAATAWPAAHKRRTCARAALSESNQCWSSSSSSTTRPAACISRQARVATAFLRSLSLVRRASEG